MNDVGTLYAQHIDAARFAVIRGDRSAAAESFRAAITIARSNAGLQRELVTALVHLGKLEQELGRANEAEQLLREALDVSERLFGAEHPSLCAVLNELSRLHIRQSDHARADAVLERLLRITRTKGEEHPDVATALAGLAMVKRGLGDDAAAEERFRAALRIREKVLAPDHMAIVVTLEQLADTCAARGNLVEALALLQRALPTREAALGPEHATVQSLRSRLVALEHVIAKSRETPPEPPAEEALPGPNDLVFIYEPERRVPRRKAPPRERMATPRYSAAVAAASLMTSPLQMAPPPQPAPSTQPAPSAKPAPPPQPAPSAQPAPSPQPPAPAAPAPLPQPAPSTQPAAPQGRPSIPTPVADMVIPVAPAPRESVQPWAKPKAVEPPVARRHAERRDLGHSKLVPAKAAAVRVARSDTRSTIAPRSAPSNAPAPKKRLNLYASVGAVAVALAIAGLTFRSSIGFEGKVVDETARPQARPAPDVNTPPTSSAATALGVASVVRLDSSRALSATPAPIGSIARSEKRAPETDAPEAEPSEAAVPNSLGAVSVPTIATTNVDSIVGASTKAGRESYTDQIVTTGGLVPSSTGDDATTRPPVLIGPAPLPHFPDALRSQRTEGEVVVRFRVDERGLIDVSSMKVVKSDHPLFTAAVRKELPRFRFQPARSPAPESKPVSDWVDFRVEFTAKN